MCGNVVTMVLSGRNLRGDDAEEILKKHRDVNDRLFDLNVEAEQRALGRKFW